MSRPVTRGASGWINRFWFALEYNDQKALRQLLAQGVNIDHTFKEAGHKRQNQTPIFIAVSKNNCDLARLLIAAGCKLEHKDGAGETVLFVAVQHGKLPMIKLLVEAGALVNHRNKKGETVLFLAIRWGRRDMVDFLIGAEADTNAESADGTTPLLLALELYDNTCTLRHATRRSAPSNMADIINVLIPMCKNINHQHPNRGSALRLALSIETSFFQDNLQLSKLLLQHGAVPDRLFFLRFGGLNATTSKPGSEFFTEQFFTLAFKAGACLQREKTWLLTVLTEMSQELQPYEDLFRMLLEKAMSPPSLQTCCLIYVRRHLLTRGCLWQSLELLPLPGTIKECLKLAI